MVKLDLREAYFWVPIKYAHCKFLCFPWRGKVYQFQAMPFGLGVGPSYYIKLLKRVIAFLQRIGVHLIVYLNDTILLNQCRHMLIGDLSSLKWLLENLLENTQKLIRKVPNLLYVWGSLRLDDIITTSNSPSTPSLSSFRALLVSKSYQAKVTLSTALWCPAWVR